MKSEVENVSGTGGATSDLTWQADVAYALTTEESDASAAAAWTPHHLLVGGVATSVMGSFLRRAIGGRLSILGYASHQRLVRADALRPEVVVQPYIVVRRGDEAAARVTLDRAVEEASVTYLSHCDLSCRPHFAVLVDEEPAYDS